MNKNNYIYPFVAFAFFCLSIQGEESGILTRAMNEAPSGNLSNQEAAQISLNKGSGSSAKKGIEFRIGPVINAENDLDIQTGRRGQSFDLKKMGLDDPQFGVKADLDFEFDKNIHWLNGVTWIHFDQTGTLNSNVTYGTGMKLLSGSRVKADLDIVKYEPKLGFDVIRTEHFRLMPYMGLMLGVSNGSVSAISGRVQREQNKISVIDRAKTYDRTELFGSYLLGFGTEYHITRDLYLGVDVGGYYMDFMNGMSGKGYVGYNFTESWLLRAGLDVDWATYHERHVDINGYSANPYVQLGVKF